MAAKELVNKGPIKNKIFLVKNEKDFKELQKKYVGFQDLEWRLNDGPIGQFSWTVHPDGYMRCAICIDTKAFIGDTIGDAVSVVAHECLHCVQRTIQWMGGHTAESIEWEAYMLDWLVDEAVAYFWPKAYKTRIKSA